MTREEKAQESTDSQNLPSKIQPFHKPSLSHLQIKGAVLIELALIVPFLLMLTLSALDLGFILRESNITAQAVRSSARSIDAEARTLNNELCSLATPLERTVSCAVLGTASAWPTGGSLTVELMLRNVARFACLYLQLSGQSADKWRVRVTAPLSIGEPPVSPELIRRFLKVETLKNTGSDPGCYFCLLGALAEVSTESSTTFPLPTQCYGT